MKNWQPLSDIWENYSDKIEQVEGNEVSEDILYPYDLFIGQNEKDDIKQFVSERIEEMVSHAQSSGGINLQWIGGFLFKSLVAGMMWERERVGK